MAHFYKDLNRLDVQNINTTSVLTKSFEDVRFEFFSAVPMNLINSLDIELNHLIDNNTSCLISFYKDLPIGCILFHNQGKAITLKNWFPFATVVNLGESHVYAHTLFVKSEFRNKGLAKLLYSKSFELLKDKFSYFDILVNTENRTANNVIRKFDFIKVREIAFVRLFNFELALNLNNYFKRFIYKLFCGLFFYCKNILKLPVLFKKHEII